MTIELFRSCLYALKKQFKTSKQQANDNDKHLAHDRLLYPTPTHNDCGLPVWVGSDAERLLKVDISNGLYTPGNVSPLYNSRDEYKLFTQDVFRGHVHQEIRKRKFVAQYASQYK